MLDNSDIDLTGVETGFPIFDNQHVNCIVSGVATVKKDGRRSKRISLTTEEAITSTGGVTKEAGMKLTDRISIDVSGGRTQERINEDLATFQKAALGLSKPEAWGSDERYVGQRIRVTLKKRADRNDDEKFFQNFRYSKAT